jgi:hypothetical protein
VKTKSSRSPGFASPARNDSTAEVEVIDCYAGEEMWAGVEIDHNREHGYFVTLHSVDRRFVNERMPHGPFATKVAAVSNALQLVLAECAILATGETTVSTGGMTFKRRDRTSG